VRPTQPAVSDVRRSVRRNACMSLCIVAYAAIACVVLSASAFLSG
jgi:hypothetical protein